MSGGVWRKTLVYLGLVEEPEEHDDLPERFDVPDRAVAEGAQGYEHADGSNVRSLRIPEPGSPHVRPMSGQARRVTMVVVERFEDCEVIGSRYRTGQPVLFDLGEVDRETARRVLDFVSGTTYALRGRLRRAGNQAFLLLPEGVDLAPEEGRRLAGMGYMVEA